MKEPKEEKKLCKKCLYMGILIDGLCGFTEYTGEICQDKSGYEEEEKKPVKLERKGACKRCGKCCQTYYLFNSFNWLEKIIVRYKLMKAGKRLDKETSKCKSLYFKKGKAICKKYDARPFFCKAFPDAPPTIDGCGFYFTKGE